MLVNRRSGVNKSDSSSETSYHGLSETWWRFFKVRILFSSNRTLAYLNLKNYTFASNWNIKLINTLFRRSSSGGGVTTWFLSFASLQVKIWPDDWCADKSTTESPFGTVTRSCATAGFWCSSLVAIDAAAVSSMRANWRKCLMDSVLERSKALVDSVLETSDGAGDKRSPEVSSTVVLFLHRSGLNVVNE